MQIYKVKLVLYSFDVLGFGFYIRGEPVYQKILNFCVPESMDALSMTAQGLINQL